MSAAAAIADFADLPDWERDLMNRQLARLERLADSAERVVAEFEARIVAPGPDLSPAERLDLLDIKFDLASRPFDVVVAMICRDLGLPVDSLPPPPPAAGGGPTGERSEHPLVEGAGGYDAAYLSSA